MGQIENDLEYVSVVISERENGRNAIKKLFKKENTISLLNIC